MVAVDSAQCAIRLGAEEVTLVALESRDAMPAYEEDVAFAEEEGIKYSSCWGVARITGARRQGRGVELKACTSVFDGNGRFQPCYNEAEIRTVGGRYRDRCRWSNDRSLFSRREDEGRKGDRGR